MPHVFSLDDKYALDTTKAYITGIEALARLPMLQHQRDLEKGLNTAGFISGYRGSPLANIDQTLWKAQQYLQRHNIVFQPGINEDLAATAVWGSQQVNLFEGAKYDGVFSLWYSKGPGVDRSMDVIKHANAFGTSKYGGVLAVAGDDHACKSSTLPHQSDHMFIGASIPILSPANVQEVLDLGIYGWELSRFCGCWVGLKAVTENMDSAISADIDPDRINIVIPDQFTLPMDGVHGRLNDAPLDQEARLNKYKIYAAREFARVNNLNKIVIDSSSARLGIMTTGKSYLDVMQALEDMGIDKRKAESIGLRVYKVGMSWPLEPVMTHRFAQGLKEILVVEEKRSILEDQLTGQLYNWPVKQRPKVIGEFDEDGNDLLPNLAELTPAMIAKAIASRMRHFYSDQTIDKCIAFYDHKETSLAQTFPRLQRSPHYCSGCPHSTSTRVPEGSRALAGIGCHYMGVWEQGDRKATTFTHMGGEGVTWVGQAPFTTTKHVFQNLGDGTYFHSGILAIRQAIASRVNITYKILYNDAVAMTGGQPVDGMLSIEQIIYQLRGEGVKRIAVVSENPEHYQGKKALPQLEGISLNHRSELIPIEKELREIAGTSILIFEQTCAAEKRRRRKKGLAIDPARRVIINPEVCESCGDCSKASNCLSVMPLETTLGRKRQIDQNACNKDFSCLNGFCPSFVTIEGGQLKPPKKLNIIQHLSELPEPTLASIDKQPWNIVVSGIGGTGVLTIASIVAMAAHIEGKGCATMNQTGLAQKFGSVVSHIRIAKQQSDINAVRIAAGDADLLLGCDLVVTADYETMAKVNVARSHAIVNEYESPTADFISQPDLVFPGDSMKQIILDETGAAKVNFINATLFATHTLGDALASNMFMLGYAYQAGLIPVSYSSLLQAIKLNGVSVDMNQQALALGRWANHDLEYLKTIVSIPEPKKPLESITDIVNDRHQRLIDYQDKRYADNYKQLVDQVIAKEQQLTTEHDNALSRNVALYYYKLMAYKDEFEIARLYTNGTFKQQLESMFEGNYRIKFHLSPPLIAPKNTETGKPEKLQFPQITLQLFKILAKLKFLRNSSFNIFGYSTERKLEKQLIQDYKQIIEWTLEHLSTDNYPIAVELATTPDDIRGFGHIKEASLQQFKQKQQKLQKQINAVKLRPLQ